jgi:hypothetical protein
MSVDKNEAIVILVQSAKKAPRLVLAGKFLGLAATIGSNVGPSKGQVC